MKAIILISSIFYILGLKISNKIDFIKKSNPVETIITNKIVPGKTIGSDYLEKEKALKITPDTLKYEGTSEDTDLKDE
jgi:hypothetical protein